MLSIAVASHGTIRTTWLRISTSFRTTVLTVSVAVQITIRVRFPVKKLDTGRLKDPSKASTLHPVRDIVVSPYVASNRRYHCRNHKPLGRVPAAAVSVACLGECPRAGYQPKKEKMGRTSAAAVGSAIVESGGEEE